MCEWGRVYVIESELGKERREREKGEERGAKSSQSIVSKSFM